MQRLKGLPGATGNSPKGRKARKPEKFACLTLLEFEHWLALEVGQRYHHGEHRGLHAATPHAAWSTLCEAHPPRQLPPGPDEVWRLLINFMPLANRSVQADGLTLFYIRYWNPVCVGTAHRVAPDGACTFNLLSPRRQVSQCLSAATRTSVSFTRRPDNISLAT